MAISVKQILPRLILALVLLGGAYYGYTRYQYNQTYETTDNAQIETYLVPVLPRVAGYVKAVHMKDYENVQKGELLVEIDDQELQLALQELEATYQQMQVDIENVRANIRNTDLSIKSAEMNMKTWQIRRDKAKKDADRDAKLFAESAVTRKQADDSQNNYELLIAQYDAGESDLTANRSKLDILRSNLHKAEAQLAVQKTRIDQQRLRISYAKIHAATAGKIGKKNVETGQYIQPGQTLATIVQDSLFWIVANFKETQLNRLKEGQPVTIHLDAYPDQELTGKILSFSDATGAKTALLPPDNASGNFVKITQKVPVKIAIDQVEKYRKMLRAGLSVDVEVKVK
ncbi:MAG: HlyD family secretion protein [Spirosomataceae bacterium]